MKKKIILFKNIRPGDQFRIDRSNGNSYWYLKIRSMPLYLVARSFNFNAVRLDSGDLYTFLPNSTLHYVDRQSRRK